ncbi:MAG: hypothetical protein KDC24_09925, partial [Saprospiraceae bacterium]|nr:hypothetical protein [Saprospiraceae bacterium]
FQGNCLFINQKEDYVDIFKKKKTVFELLGKPDYKIPFNLLGHLPVIKAKIGGMVVFCGIDTGSSIHLVDEELTKKYCLNKGAGNYEYVKGIGTENLVRKEIKIIPRLEAGNAVQWETDCVPANLSHLQEPTFNWKIEALLGMPFFKHYKYILIDYRSLNIFMWE